MAWHYYYFGSKMHYYYIEYMGSSLYRNVVSSLLTLGSQSMKNCLIYHQDMDIGSSHVWQERSRINTESDRRPLSRDLAGLGETQFDTDKRFYS